MGVFQRGNKLWVRYQDADGTWRNASTGYILGQEKLAEAVFDEIASRVRAATAAGEIVVGPLTVRRWAEEWLRGRRDLDVDYHNDESRLRHHVLPVIGDMLIANVRTRHMIDLFNRIRHGKERPVAPRTVHSIYSTVAAMFRDAKLADKIEQTPCCLTERQLGELVDKDREWRKTAVFSRDEAEEIISCPEIPFDRCVVYALELLAGVRTGEAAALRWRHYDPTKKPLGELFVASAYSTRKGREKGTKTESVKYIPVHPTLAAMLAEWKLGGWAAMMGRHPEPDDLIVPLPPDSAARRVTRAGDPFRGHDYSGQRWRKEDLPALGWRHRRHYDMRATFITLALDDGADRYLIESRVTHTKKPRSAFELYDRNRYWAVTCAEVVKLKIARRPAGRGEVIALPIAAGAEGTETGAEAPAAAADGPFRYSARYSPRKDEQSEHSGFTGHAREIMRRRGQVAASHPPREPTRTACPVLEYTMHHEDRFGRVRAG
jgi:integrase